MPARMLRLLSIIVALALITVSPSLVQATATPTADEAWQVRDVVVEPAEPAVGQVVTVRFTVVDEQGEPVDGLRVRGVLRAPTQTQRAEPPEPIIIATGRPVDAGGGYAVSLALNQPGPWWIEVEAEDSIGLHSVRLSHFIDVNSVLGVPPSQTDQPLFLRRDAWGVYYRLDPQTGNIATMSGQQVTQVGDRWWVADTATEPIGPVSPRYGGTWRVRIALSDGLSGQQVSTIDLGDIRASVHVGSVDEPAIATALAFSPDGTQAYVYWARQLGEGWLARVAVADTATGEIHHQRVLRGAITADGAWANLTVTPDGGQVVIAEQVVRSLGVSGYRLITLRTDTLEPVTEHRRVSAPEDPLTGCLLAYPGPVGVVAAGPPLRYSLCQPNGSAGPLALLIWNPLTGSVIHRVDLSALAGETPAYVDGVAAPDGRRFYAVNTLAGRIAVFDLVEGTLLRQADFVSRSESAPSPWDRFFNWLFGLITPSALAGVLVEPGLTVTPDGSTLYLVAPTTANDQGFGDGVWVIDATTLSVKDHILVGQPVAGVVTAPNGHLAVVRQSSESEPDRILLVDPEGGARVTLVLPEGAGLAHRPQ